MRYNKLKKSLIVMLLLIYVLPAVFADFYSSNTHFFSNESNVTWTAARSFNCTSLQVDPYCLRIDGQNFCKNSVAPLEAFFTYPIYIKMENINYTLINMSSGKVNFNITYNVTGEHNNTIDECYGNFTDTIVRGFLEGGRCKIRKLNYTQGNNSYFIPRVNETYGQGNSTTINHLINITFHGWIQDTGYNNTMQAQRFRRMYNVTNNFGRIFENVSWSTNTSDTATLLNVTSAAKFNDTSKKSAVDWILEDDTFTIAGASFNVQQNYSVTRYLKYRADRFPNTGKDLPPLVLTIPMINYNGTESFEKKYTLYSAANYTRSGSSMIANLTAQAYGGNRTYRYTHLSTLITDSPVAASFTDNIPAGVRTYTFNPDWGFNVAYNITGKTIIKRNINESQYLGEWNNSLRYSTSTSLKDSAGASISHSYVDSENSTRDITWTSNGKTGAWPFDLTYLIQIMAGISPGGGGGGGGPSGKVVLVMGSNESIEYENDLLSCVVFYLPKQCTMYSRFKVTGGTFYGNTELAPNLAKYCKPSVCLVSNDNQCVDSPPQNNIKFNENEEKLLKITCNLPSEASVEFAGKPAIQGQFSFKSSTKSFPTTISIDKAPYGSYEAVQTISEQFGVSPLTAAIIFSVITMLILFGIAWAVTSSK
jgi:hypothetical protein